MFQGGFGGFGGFDGFGGSRMDEEASEKKEVDNSKYYELLAVDKKATTEEIRKAFRRKALKQHPDKGGDPQKFKEISAAHEVLSNPEKRQLYDDYGQEGVKNGGPPGGGGFGGLFEMFTGGRKKPSGPVKGKPKLIELEVTLQQIYNGAMRNLKISRTRICQPCEGKGGKNVVKCVKCKGSGVVTKMVQLGPGMYSQSQAKCTDCKGNGETMKEQDKCQSCKGQKVIKVDKTLQVAIESGCPNEHDYVFTGENDEYPGVIAGDVYVRIKIKKHNVFQRRGADLVIIKKISLLEALTGVTMQIKHLDGKKHVIATCPGQILHNEDLKTIRGLGFPFYKDPMSHGNLIVQFIAQFPKKNAFSKDTTLKITKILGGTMPNIDDYLKNKTNTKNKILQDYREKDLNSNPKGAGGDQEEQYAKGQSGARQVRCQQQ